MIVKLALNPEFHRGQNITNLISRESVAILQQPVRSEIIRLFDRSAVFFLPKYLFWLTMPLLILLTEGFLKFAVKIW